MLTETDVSYEWTDGLTRNLHCRVHHKLRNQWQIQNYERGFQPFTKKPAQFELKTKEYLDQTALLESLNPTALLEYLNYQDWNLFKWGFPWKPWNSFRSTTGNGLLGKLFHPLPCITTNKLEIHEETSITNNCFNFMWINGHITYNFGVHCNQIKIFELFLLGKIKWYPGFNYWLLPSPRTRHVKKSQIFSQLFIQCTLDWKICNALFQYVQFSQIRSQMKTKCECEWPWETCTWDFFGSFLLYLEYSSGKR